MKFLLFFFITLLLQEEVPFKPADEFEVTLDYQFKPYKDIERKDADYTALKKRTGSLLYLIARVKLKKISAEETKIRVLNNNENSVLNKKAEQDMVLKIDFGFIEDVKDRMTAHEYQLVLISPDKKEISRIHLFIEKDGTFLINGQKRGKF